MKKFILIFTAALFIPTLFANAATYSVPLAGTWFYQYDLSSLPTGTFYFSCPSPILVWGNGPTDIGYFKQYNDVAEIPIGTDSGYYNFSVTSNLGNFNQIINLEKTGGFSCGSSITIYDNSGENCTSVAHGSYTSFPSCDTINCDMGYHLTGGACVANSSGGSTSTSGGGSTSTRFAFSTTILSSSTSILGDGVSWLYKNIWAFLPYAITLLVLVLLFAVYRILKNKSKLK